MLPDRDAPCEDMFNSVMWFKLENPTQYLPDNCLTTSTKGSCMEIVYVEKYYEEIKQLKDFDFQDSISNLGGFIGIFLGYSMMQIPGLLCVALHHLLSMVDGVRIYWKKYSARNRLQSCQDANKANENQGCNQEKNESDVRRKFSTDQIDERIDDLQISLIDENEKLRKYIKNIEKSQETKRIAQRYEISKRFERLEHKLEKHFSFNK